MNIGKRIASACTALAVCCTAFGGLALAAPSEADMGEYIPNDIDLSYTSMFEERGVEAVIRDSVIGGERSSLFNDGWLFMKTADFETDYSGADDSGWQKVTLPHDFQIIQTGNMGNRYALYQDRKGWYKKHFNVGEDMRGKHISLRFDGVYQASKVYVNGVELPEFDINDPDASPYSGTHYYGYKTFEVDLTDYLNYGGENVIAVSAEDKHNSSRWYTGSGINRNVWLTVTDKIHIDFNGTYVSYDLNDDYSSALVNIKTEIRNDSGSAEEVTVRQSLYNNGEQVAVSIADEILTAESGAVTEAGQEFRLDAPKLWGIDGDQTENLYTLRTEILADGEVRDTYLSEFGIRDIQWYADTGVYLNGEHIKLEGVCMHENYGALGSANNAAALERQMVILKRMGINAVRTAHNICTPELITICSRLGILVYEEAYDSWDDTKSGEYTLGGQGLFFGSYESDMRSMVRRDRNAPCVFLWGIGNEIVQTVWGSMDNVREKVENMLDYICEEDPEGGRFITLAQMQWTTDFSMEVSAYICDYLKDNYTDCGVMGQNYREYYLQQAHEKYPGYRMLGAELASAMRSRGVYHEGEYVYAHDDLQLSSLDNCGTAYALSAESMYMFDSNRDWYAGGFIWSGFDYIGESTPYDTKNSYFGIVDTAGLPKDIYYFYRSIWNDEEDTVHILPYWDKNDGDRTEVMVYSNAEKVELYYVPEAGSGYEEQYAVDTIDRAKTTYDEGWDIGNKPVYSDKLHFSFDMEYHPGTVYAVATYADGHKKYTSLSTPSDTAALTLRADRTAIAADGIDTAAVEINTVDENGNVVALSSDRIKIEVSGAGEFVGADTGNAVDMESYQSNTRRLFNGKAAAFIRSNGGSGDITVKVSGIGVEPAEIKLTAKDMDARPLEKADSIIDTSIPLGNTVYARKLEITPAEGYTNVLTEAQPEAVFEYRLLPENVPGGASLSGGEFEFSVIGTDGYVRVNNAAVSVDEENRTVTVTGLKPGTFRLYGTYTNGWSQPQLLSTYTIVNESAVSDDPSLRNDAYSHISALRLDPSSRNSSYTVDYDEGVIRNINRTEDSLVYKDVEFGTDYSRRLILNCVNTSSDTDAVLDVYIDGEVYTAVTIPAGGASSYSKNALKEYSFDCFGITGTHDVTFVNTTRPTLHVEGFRFTGSGNDFYELGKPVQAENFDYTTSSQSPPTVDSYTDDCGSLQKVLNIQDNTAVYYKGVDLGETGSDTFEICMKMNGDSSRIAVKIGDGGEQYYDWSNMEAYYTEGEYRIYRVKLDKVYTGVQEIMLMAYPGASTYIDRFRFIDTDGMLFERHNAFYSSDGWRQLSGGEPVYGKSMNVSDTGVRIDVTELIKAFPSGTEFTASARVSSAAGRSAELYFETSGGERITLDTENGADETVLSGSAACAYGGDDRVYLCIAQSASGFRVYSAALAAAGAAEQSIPGELTEAGRPVLVKDSIRYSITAKGTFSQNAKLNVMLGGESIAVLEYTGANELSAITEEAIRAGLYTLDWETESGSAEVGSLTFEESDNEIRVELINNEFSTDGDLCGYMPYTDGDGTLSAQWGKLTASGFSSGYDENNGIKLDITDIAAEHNNGSFGARADVDTTANGELRLFAEVLHADGSSERYMFASDPGGTGAHTLSGTIDKLSIEEGDKVYLCITQWSGYVSFDNIKLWYNMTIEKKTIFKHTFNKDKETQTAMYEPYEENGGTIGGANSTVFKYTNGSGSVSGVKIDLNKNFGLTEELSGYVFGASMQMQPTAWNSGDTASMFFEITGSNGTRKVILSEKSKDTDTIGKLDDSETGVSIGNSWFSEPFKGEAELSFESGETVYLCVTTTADLFWLDDVTVYSIGEVKPEPEKISVFEHTFNKDKAEQIAMYEPYAAGDGTVSGGNNPVLKYENGTAAEHGIKINVTEKIGLSQDMSGRVFGASADIKPWTTWNGFDNVKLFFEVAGSGGTRRIELFEATPSNTSSDMGTDTETGADLDTNWITGQIDGSALLEFGEGDEVYLCITSSASTCWYDNIRMYYEKGSETVTPDDPDDDPTQEPEGIIIGAPRLTERGAEVTVENHTGAKAVLCIYAASYDSEGRLLSLKKTTAEAEPGSKAENIAFEAKAGDTVFIWDEDMKPYTEASVIR